MSVLCLVLRERRTFGYVLVYVQGQCCFLSFSFSLSHVEGWYWIWSRAMWRVLFMVRAALELRDNQRYGYFVAIKYYGTVFLKIIVRIKLIDLPDNIDGYWPVIHYCGIVVMVMIDENWVSDEPTPKQHFHVVWCGNCLWLSYYDTI